MYDKRIDVCIKRCREDVYIYIYIEAIVDGNVVSYINFIHTIICPAWNLISKSPLDCLLWASQRSERLMMTLRCHLRKESWRSRVIERTRLRSTEEWHSMGFWIASCAEVFSLYVSLENQTIQVLHITHVHALSITRGLIFSSSTCVSTLMSFGFFWHVLPRTHQCRKDHCRQNSSATLLVRTDAVGLLMTTLMCPSTDHLATHTCGLMLIASFSEDATSLKTSWAVTLNPSEREHKLQVSCADHFNEFVFIRLH